MAELSSPGAVRAAAREFDALGEEAFLYEYDFESTSDCVVVIDGRPYPARAILGAARGHQFPDIGPISDSDLGGALEVAAKLRELGFEVLEVGDGHAV